ncbi:type I methionyl aminopeptidase [candidate division WOR-3 bacterium]|nr:type I methionyl aminopeptidase [candidate division WOR-3 bacterium]
MAVYLKNPREVEGIRRAGSVAAGALKAAAAAVAPGATLIELERVCVDHIRANGAEPTFLGYRGFPGAVCVSVNEEVVHGIAGSRALAEGDIVKIDVGVTKDGLIADMARTFAVGRVSAEVRTLMLAAEESFSAGMAQARAGRRVSDISRAIEEHVVARGYSVVRELCGHGVGIELHEEPGVPNFVGRHRGIELRPGMTLAIEPMVNMGGFEVRTLENGWTVVAADGRPSAHYENTVLVTGGEPEILTRAQD